MHTTCITISKLCSVPQMLFLSKLHQGYTKSMHVCNQGQGNRGTCVPPPPIFWRVWDTISSVPLKIGVRLHHRASKMQIFPEPLIGPAPHTVKASHTHAPSSTDLHLPLERVEGTYTPPHPTPFSKVGGGTVSNVPRVV